MMKKRVLSLVLTLAMVMSLFTGMTATASAAGEQSINLSDLEAGVVVPVGTVININVSGHVYVDDYRSYLWEMAGRDSADKTETQKYYAAICESNHITDYGDYYASGNYDTTVVLAASMKTITTTQGWLCYKIDTHSDGKPYACFVSPDTLGGANSALKFDSNSYSVEKGSTVDLNADFAAGTAPNGDYDVVYSLIGTYTEGTSVNAETGLLTAAAGETAATITVQAMVKAGSTYVTNVAVTVSGNGSGGEQPGNHEAKIDDTPYDTLAAAVAAATAGNTIKLLKDVTVVPSNEAPCVLLPDGVTLDLNGQTLTGNVQGTVAMKGGELITIDPRKNPAEMKMIAAEGNDFAYLSEDGVFDIKLYKVENGQFVIENANLVPDRALTFVSGSVTLNGDEWRTDTDQTVTLKKEASLNIPTGKTFEIQTGTKVVIEDPAKVIINGTVVAAATIGNNYYGDLATAIADAKSGDTVVLVADIVLPGAGLEVEKNVTLDLNGKNISAPNDNVGDGIFYVTAGTLTINGNGIINGVGNNNYSMAIWADGGHIVINGGTYTNVGAGEQDHYDLIYAKNGGTVTINGGTFECQTPRWTLNVNNASNSSKIIVKGGTFKGFDPAGAMTDDTIPEGGQNPVNYVASGYKSVDNGDGTFSVEEDVIRSADGVYPYGQAMTDTELTLIIPVEGQNYQWQSSTPKNDGTYTDYTSISGAETKELTLSNPASGTWYRCVVDGEASKAVQVVTPNADGKTWTGYSGSYYITNGTVAYRVNGANFDVTGLYVKGGTSYMMQTSFGYDWEMFSSDQPTPQQYNNYIGNAQLDALRVFFDENDDHAVIFEADLKDGQKAFAFGCDTQLGDGDTSGSYADDAALIGTVKDDVLQQVAMIGAASVDDAKEDDPAFVIAPAAGTPASKFWLGYYNHRQAYVYNTGDKYTYTRELIGTENVVTTVGKGEDSGMTMSWLNVPSGGSVGFVFKVGTVGQTGAVPSASVELTSKTITIKDTESSFFYQILDKNGNPVTGITYENENGNQLDYENGWIQGVGGDIIITGLQQSTTYKIVTAAKDEHGVLDEQNKAVEEVVTPINPEMTVNPESGVETKINCVATGNSLTFSGLNNTYYYFLETADGYVIDAPASPTNGELAFTDLPAGYKLYLGAVSEDNEYYDPVEYSTNPVTVTYDANGGENAPAAHTLSGERQYLAGQEPTLVCHNFLGWAKSSTATSPDCDPEFPCLPGDTTLYAVWGLGVHSWATDWSSDNTNHWHECTRDGCDAIDNKEEHHYTDGYCECGKEEPVYYIPETPPTVDVPVSNDENKVDVKAEVSGKDATIKPLDDKQIEQIVGDTEAAGDVVIDLSDLGKTIDTAGIPKKTLEAIVEAAEDAGNKTEHLVIKLSTAELKLDDAAMRAIVDQANGNIIKFNFDDVGTTRLNYQQKEAIKNLDVRKGFEAYITVNGQRVSDFKGGEVEIIVPYAVPAGEKVAGFSVWYIDEDGNPEKQKSTYDGKNKWFVVSHFSDYVIAYSEEDAQAGNYHVCPKDETCPIHAYTDTDKTTWYHDGVHYCIENGLMNGISDIAFAPGMITTRAMIATILWRMEGEPTADYTMTFEDVAAGQWYTEAIRWAQSVGVVEGYNAESFGPTDTITREQMATVLWRYAKYKGIDVSVGEDTNILGYADVFDVSNWAMEAMQWACGSGMIQGIEKNGAMYLDPQGDAVRCQSATLFYRFCTEIKK